MTYQQKLQELRDAWVKEKDPVKKKIIEQRAKLLKWSMHPSEVYQEEKDRELEKNVRNTLC